jgi:hypothetical protein
MLLRVAIDEILEEIKLLVIPGQKLSQEISILKLLFYIHDFLRELHFVVEPAQN